MDKVAQIRSLVRGGHAADVRELLLGISRYSCSGVEQVSWNAEETELRQMAEIHLNFVATYGADVAHVKDGKFHRFAYVREFDRWLEAGAPGVIEEDLAAYISGNPVNGITSSSSAA